MLRLLWNVSRPELGAKPVRVGLFVASIAIGVAMMTAMRVATDSVVAGLSADLAALAGHADLQVTFGTGEAGFPEEILYQVQRQPYVAHAAALVRGALTFADGSNETLELFGVDLLQSDVRDLYDVEVLDRTADDFTIVNDPHAVFLTAEVAGRRGLAVGDSVDLVAAEGTASYTVRGILRPRGLATIYGGRLAVMFLPAAQAVCGKQAGLYESQVDQIDVELAPGVAVAEAEAKLAAVLPDTLTVSQPLQRRVSGEETVAGLRATLVGMSSLALLAAMFIVYATTATLVRHRLPTMATLLSVGADAPMLVRMLLCEAALLGLAGAIAGVFVGLALASFISKDVAEGMSLNYSIALSPALHLEGAAGLFLVYPLIGVIAAVCSAWVPARGLLREEPLTLRERRGKGGALELVPASALVKGALLMLAAGAAAIALGVRSQSAASCTAGGLAVLLGSIVAVVPAVRSLWGRLVAPLSRRFGIVGRIAGESLDRDTQRSIISVTAIALCISVAVGASTLALSFRRSIVHWYGFSGDAVIGARSMQGGWLSSPVEPDLEARLAALPAVGEVETLRVSQGQPYGGERIAVVALSEGFAAAALRDAARVTAGGVEAAASSFAAGRGAVVSENFASHFGVRPGDRLRLSSPTGTLELPVVASVPDFVSDKGSVLLARALYRRHWRDSLVNYLVVDLAAGYDLGDLRGQVVDSVEGGEQLSVLATADLVHMVEGFIATAFADMDTIQLLVIVITLAGIVDFLVSNILDRRRELSLLRMVGASVPTLVRAIVIEAVLLGAAAGLLGAAAGAVSAWIWVKFNYAVLVGYVLDMNFSWAAAATCLALAVLTAAVTGAITALNTVRSSALAGMRFD